MEGSWERGSGCESAAGQRERKVEEMREGTEKAIINTGKEKQKVEAEQERQPGEQGCKRVRRAEK